jgi:hypothetical protein
MTRRLDMPEKDLLETSVFLFARAAADGDERL